MEIPTQHCARNIGSRLMLVGVGYVYSLTALIPNGSAIYLLLRQFQLSYLWGMSMFMACTFAVFVIADVRLKSGETGLALILGAPSTRAEDFLPGVGGMGWYLFLSIVALWGGLLAHARRYEDGQRPKSVAWTLVVDICGAGLVTVAVYAISIWAGASQFMSVALAGILGHNGVRLLTVFEDEITLTVRSVFASLRHRLGKQ